MSIFSMLRTDFDKLISMHGVRVSVQNQSASQTSSDYDDGAFSSSGTAVTGSVFILPPGTGKGADGKRYLAQGVIDQAEKVMFVPSGIEINATAVVSGAALEREYEVVDGGIVHWPTLANLVYSEVYLRAKRP